MGSSDVGSKRRIRNGSVLYGDTLQDFHQHRLEEGYDPLELKYSLYAIAVSKGNGFIGSQYEIWRQKSLSLAHFL